MKDLPILIAIFLLATLAWWVDSMIPRWFKKEGKPAKIIPMSPKFSGEEKKGGSVPEQKSGMEIGNGEADNDVFY